MNKPQFFAVLLHSQDSLQIAQEDFFVVFLFLTERKS